MTLIDTSSIKSADTATPILPVLAERWSPRSYSADEVIDETKLAAALEAARWSPSANNRQSWRFIVARRGAPEHAAIAATLMSFNAVWAPNAAVLIVAIAETVDADGKTIPTALYDLGQAMAHLSVQAHHDGLHVHQMTGFVREDLARAFDLPESLVPFTVAALGTVVAADALPELLAERELAPRIRKPLDEIVLVNA